MAYVAGSTAANTIDTELNITRDYIAQRTSAVTPITKGGTGAITASAARAALGITATTVPSGVGLGSNVQADLDYVSGVAASAAGVAAAASAAAADAADGHFGANVLVSTGSYNTNVSGGGVRVAYLASDGRLGYSPSTRELKQDIAAWTPDRQAVLALELVTFRYKAHQDGPLEVGLIAEQLLDLGLDWLVFSDENGDPAGVHYERLALALLPVMQDHEARLSALEDSE
jgi:hypothetical protein